MSNNNDVFARFRQELNTRGVDTKEPTALALYGTSKISKTSRTSKSPSIAVNHKLPSASLLNQKMLGQEQPEQDYTQAIIETYASFGVPVSAHLAHQGPRLCQYALRPGYIEKKVKGEIVHRRVMVNALTRLEKDLALGLATSLCITEVANKPYLGVEIPRSYPQLVSLCSVLSSSEFAKIEMAGGLGLALGVTVTGQPLVVDLTEAPHMLIAGATGSGKSRCIDSIIASLLMNHSPASVRLILIDPKQVELLMYARLPHLMRPVITDMEEASKALLWAVNEMERRYSLMAEVGQREIQGFNQWAVKHGKKTLPRVVIVIDELADLMMRGDKDEIEHLICLLTQKARAIGIHLVLATQRPSVNVVTGLIKANITVRAAFKVASNIDSRVILDKAGAENLLGKGDCLVSFSRASLLRMQGCFVTDEELAAITNHWAAISSSEPRRRVQGEVIEATPRTVTTSQSNKLFEAALAIVQEEGKASVSLFQRRLRVSFKSAAELVQALKEKSLIG